MTTGEAPRDCASLLVSGIDCQLRLLEYELKRLQRDFVEEVKYDSSQTIAY